MSKIVIYCWVIFLDNVSSVWNWCSLDLYLLQIASTFEGHLSFSLRDPVGAYIVRRVDCVDHHGLVSTSTRSNSVLLTTTTIIHDSTMDRFPPRILDFKTLWVEDTLNITATFSVQDDASGTWWCLCSNIVICLIFLILCCDTLIIFVDLYILDPRGLYVTLLFVTQG